MAAAWGRLRAMTVSDLDTVLPIQREGAIECLSAVFPQDLFPFPTQSVRQRWVEEIADPGVDCFVVVNPDGEILGFAATRGNEFLHFGTALRTWGSGLASSAHDAVLAHLRSLGHEQVSLRVFEGNVRGRRFYDKHGWTPTGARTHSAFAPNPVLLTYTTTLTVRVQRVAAYGLARRGETVLLVRVADTSGGELWMLPGGGIDHGETPEAAVVRELAEETGFDVVVDRLLDVGSDHRTLRDGTDYHGVFALYDVSIIGGKARDEVAGSTDKVEWVHLSHVPELSMLGGFRELLERWMTYAPNGSRSPTDIPSSSSMGSSGTGRIAAAFACRIRDGRPADVDAMTWARSDGQHDAWQHQADRAETGEVDFLVAELGGRILGKAVLDWTRNADGTPWLWMVSVDPDHRGQGIGGLMLAVAEARALERGRASIEMAVDDDNARVRDLYLRNGYAVVGPHVDEYDVVQPDGRILHVATPGVVLRKTLSPEVPRLT